MSEITGGELFARCLEAEGIRFVFGLPCPEIDPLLAALDAHDIRFVPIRHEAAAVYMAMGIYKTTGQVAAVLGNPGPGSANLVPGVATARHEGVPVLVITAQHRLGIVYPSPPSTFQGQDQLDMFRPLVKFGAPILAWERIPDVLAMAFREMGTGRPGPVHVELPAPVVYATFDESAAAPLDPSLSRAPVPQASAEQLDAAADMLASASRPLLVCGSGLDRSGGGALAVELAELLGCPFANTMAARTATPIDHPQHVQAFGGGGDVAKQESDVVLVLGSRMGNLDLPYDKYWGAPAGKKIIQVDVDPRNMGVTRPITLGIVSDAKFALTGLLARLKARGVAKKDPAYLARCTAAGTEWFRDAFADVGKWTGPGLHPAHAMEAIGKTFGKDAVYVTDGGNTSLWASWYLPATNAASYLAILEFGMLGTGVPSAIGAKLANPEREIVCVTGDGAAGFHFLEMQAAARDGIKVTTVVMAEGSWTMEMPNELMLFGKTFGTDMGTVRWDTVAEGLGCECYYAESVEDLNPALAKARASTKPAVVCVRTSREANLSVPPALLQRFMEVYNGPM